MACGDDKQTINPNGDPRMQFSMGQAPSNVSPMAIPQQSQISNPYGNADEQTIKMIDNMKSMQMSGAFDTPYQKAMKNHPILMGLSNAAQAFGQGLTKQPYYTSNQENQASLQNTQQQGINSIATLPAQLRMQMAMMGIGNMGGQSQGQVPGIGAQLPTTISTPSGGFDWSKVEGYHPSEGINYNPVKQKIQLNPDTGTYRIANRS